MQVSRTNDVKIYNLSAGKTLPEWISERKRRQLVKQDIDIRKRIELIQDFDMPALSDVIRVSKDGQYLLSTGIYKPRVKCYDLNNLGIKFERCLDAEVVTFEILSDDYSKVVFLQCDRYVELHTQQGRYYRLRIPKYGRDMAYHPTSCDLYFAAAGNEIYRLNLEQGRFLNSLETEASSMNCIKINPENGLVCAGSSAGRIEAWDPRSRSRVGLLDCALQALSPDSDVTSVPSISSIAFRDGLNLGVGTSTGQVLLYDLRSNKPLRTKDHMYGLPIKKIEFHKEHGNDYVLSMDAQTVKIWDRGTGKAYTSIEATADFNDLCLYKQSGILFLANEQPKMQVFYIPSLGPAPRWASFLDSITEELEESRTATTYDDYKFITKEELYDIGLDHLIGSALLRAHMHGFYMDIRLYRKAVSAKAPSRMETLKKDFIKGEIDKTRAKRVQVESNLPSVNKDLFLKLKSEKMDEKKKKKRRKEEDGDILQDSRFSSLFTDKNFEVDTTEETYRLINPVVAKLDKSKASDLEKRILAQQDEESDLEQNSEDEDMAESESESSDDDQEWTKQIKKEHKTIQAEKRMEQRMVREVKQAEKLSRISRVEHKFSELSQEEDQKKKKRSKLSLEERLTTETENTGILQTTETGHTYTFNLDKPKLSARREEEQKKHLEERKEVRRSAKHLKKDKLPPRFWMGKRVK
ncbi:nucleolar protein 10 [Eurytemora carolleeae]|uniref:nucleolar protein 10 n=1 Tax=Eurytemora carolleeae TaxID=1294199 RepID=UPI000C75DC8A|nr:nucleolar protein 10 [Eurytemora carolleeae]|eukprot:XP_023332640.1 nucleolar protein 10-like [Eurytemora affinis]